MLGVAGNQMGPPIFKPGFIGVAAGILGYSSYQHLALFSGLLPNAFSVISGIALALAPKVFEVESGRWWRNHEINALAAASLTSTLVGVITKSNSAAAFIGGMMGSSYIASHPYSTWTSVVGATISGSTLSYRMVDSFEKSKISTPPIDIASILFSSLSGTACGMAEAVISMGLSRLLGGVLRIRSSLVEKSIVTGISLGSLLYPRQNHSEKISAPAHSYQKSGVRTFH